LTYSAKSTKTPKIQVIGDLGCENPAILGRKNRTCHVMAPPVLTWRMQLFVTVHILCAGGVRAHDMATSSPKLECFFKHIKKANIFLYIIANLAGSINKY
jgi:hypothetical protein